MLCWSGCVYFISNETLIAAKGKDFHIVKQLHTKSIKHHKSLHVSSRDVNNCDYGLHYHNLTARPPQNRFSRWDASLTEAGHYASCRFWSICSFKRHSSYCRAVRFSIAVKNNANSIPRERVWLQKWRFCHLLIYTQLSMIWILASVVLQLCHLVSVLLLHIIVTLPWNLVPADDAGKWKLKLPAKTAEFFKLEGE